MPLKKQVRSNWPPGGWIYFQPQTNWHAPNPLAFTFHQQVKNIIDHRLANPRFKLPTDFPTVAEELDTYTCVRLAFDPKFVEGETKKAIARSKPQSLFGRSAELVAGVDSSVLEDWLGAGMKPVSTDLAIQRATVCSGGRTGNRCSENVTAGWRDLVTKPFAIALQKYMEAKHQLKAETPFDKTLGLCNVCRCYLQLKVFTPIQHIKFNLDSEDLNKLPAHCWIKREITG